jgi:hypothetical protein
MDHGGSEKFKLFAAGSIDANASRERASAEPDACEGGEVSTLAQLHARPGFLFRRAGQLVAHIAEQETAKIGLSAPQHVCLIALHRCSAQGAAFQR